MEILASALVMLSFASLRVVAAQELFLTPTGSLNRHLLQVDGTGTPDCDTLCRRRAVILEGIFVVVFLVVVLASGLCCMKGVKAPARFEVSKEQ
jgi:hypothetical protein